MKWTRVSWGVLAFLIVAACASDSNEPREQLQVTEQAIGDGRCDVEFCAMIGTTAGDNCYVSYPDQCGGCPAPACGAPNAGCLQPFCADVGAMYGDFCSDFYTVCKHCPAADCARRKRSIDSSKRRLRRCLKPSYGTDPETAVESFGGTWKRWIA